VRLKTCKDVCLDFGIEQECNLEDHGFFYEQDLLYTQHFGDEIWRVCSFVARDLEEKNYQIKWEYKQ
jgi:hypothetical protein